MTDVLYVPIDLVPDVENVLKNLGAKYKTLGNDGAEVMIMVEFEPHHKKYIDQVYKIIEDARKVEPTTIYEEQQRILHVSPNDFLDFANLMRSYEIVNATRGTKGKRAIIVVVCDTKRKLEAMKIFVSVSSDSFFHDDANPHEDQNMNGASSGHRTFYVPAGLILEFAKFMEDYSLYNTIAGPDGDEVIVDVTYNEEDAQELIDEIQEEIDRYNSESGLNPRFPNYN